MMSKTIAALALLLATQGVLLADSHWSTLVRDVAPASIEITALEEKDDAIVIEGKAPSNPDVAAYLKILDDKIGSPELQYVKRDGNISLFSIKVKKPKA